MDKINDENKDKKDLKFKKITNKLLIGMDIGGSLTKICILSESKEKFVNDFLLSKKFENIKLDSYNLYFNKLPTIDFEKDTISLLKEINNNIGKINVIYATGGGAHKYNDVLKKNINIDFTKHDELQSLIFGYKFMNSYSSFYEIEGDDNVMKNIPPEELKFPHILANIGSGVSILKVLSKDKYERVGGTLMGGGTLIGLSKLIIGKDDFNEIMQLAKKGNNENVDIISNNNIVSSLGKIHEYVQAGKKDEIKKEDIALSLLNMICFHIAQYTVLYAEKDKIDTIYYFGTFTKRNSIVNNILAKASKHWNKNIKVRFNYYDGYLGTIGTLLDNN
jgi:type II pantothenate kinase